MKITLFNFRRMRPVTLEAERIWRPEICTHVLEIPNSNWIPLHYVPESYQAGHELALTAITGLTSFRAVQRVLVTLEELHWPPGFNLLYQNNPLASQDHADVEPQANWYQTNRWDNLVPTAIDPPQCDCTECKIGESVDWCSATHGLVRDLVAGYIRNNTEQEHWTTFQDTGDGSWEQELVSEYP